MEQCTLTKSLKQTEQVPQDNALSSSCVFLMLREPGVLWLCADVQGQVFFWVGGIFLD